MSVLAKAVLDRYARIAELGQKIQADTPKALAAGAGSKAMTDVRGLLDEYESLNPFGMSESDDQMQQAGLKAKGRDLEMKQAKLAQILLDEGDHNGMRESILRDYEAEMNYVERVLEDIS